MFIVLTTLSRLHLYPNGKRPTRIGDPALDPRRGFSGINLLKDFGLLGIVCDGLVKAFGPMVQPGRAVMPNESVISCGVSVRGINPERMGFEPKGRPTT